MGVEEDIEQRFERQEDKMTNQLKLVQSTLLWNVIDFFDMVLQLKYNNWGILNAVNMDKLCSSSFITNRSPNYLHIFQILLHL